MFDAALDYPDRNQHQMAARILKPADVPRLVTRANFQYTGNSWTLAPMVESTRFFYCRCKIAGGKIVFCKVHAHAEMLLETCRYVRDFLKSLSPAGVLGYLSGYFGHQDFAEHVLIILFGWPSPTLASASHSVSRLNTFRPISIVSGIMTRITSTTAHCYLADMNRLSLDDRAKLIGLLVEGMSLRAATRLSGVSINTVSKLLVDVGTACAKHHDEHVRNLLSRRVQAEEIWSFVYAKAKNVPEEKQGFGTGDVWTWTAMDADSKLMISYLV